MRDLAVEIDLHRGHRGRSADRAERGEDLVLLHQLLRREHRLLGIVAVVLDDEAQLAAVHAAFGIDLVDAHAHAVHGGLRQRDDRPGQVLRGADDDLVGGHALLRERRTGDKKRKHCDE